MALHSPARNPLTKPVAMIADAITDVIAPPRRSLPPGEVRADIHALRERAAERRARLDGVRSYRRRWLQATEEQVVEVAVQRLRRRSTAHAPASRRVERRPTR